MENTASSSETQVRRQVQLDPRLPAKWFGVHIAKLHDLIHQKLRAGDFALAEVLDGQETKFFMPMRRHVKWLGRGALPDGFVMGRMTEEGIALLDGKPIIAIRSRIEIFEQAAWCSLVR